MNRIKFFLCKLCGEPFKKLRLGKTGWQFTLAPRYAPLFANHLKYQHPAIYRPYEEKYNQKLRDNPEQITFFFTPQGQVLEQLEKENSQLIQGTEQEFQERLWRVYGGQHA